MKIGIGKVLAVSTLLWIVFTLLFVFQFISSVPLETYPPYGTVFTPSMWICLFLLWLFGMISIFGSLYDILTSKNSGIWKAAWALAILILNVFAVIAYLLIGRRSRI